MFTFDVRQCIPRFILNDKNGFAVAKAIEAGMQAMNDTIQQGVKCIADYDTMPEWRLDELAWENNCLYDYGASIEAKRNWIKDSIPLYRLFGTPMAVYKYIGSYFDDIDLEEDWVYNGEPYHFRVTVDGEWTPKNEAWARKAIATAKNVRSVLDNLRIGSKCSIGMTAESGILARFAYPMTGETNWAGRWPIENVLGVLDDTSKAGFIGEAEGHGFPYPLTGTKPEINILGITDGAQVGYTADAAPFPFAYPMTGTEQRTGTQPQESTLGATGEARAGYSAEAVPRPFRYPLTGTQPQENTSGMTDESSIRAAQAEDTYTKILYKLCGQDEF